MKVVFLLAVIGVVGSKAPAAFHSFNKAGEASGMHWFYGLHEAWGGHFVRLHGLPAAWYQPDQVLAQCAECTGLLVTLQHCCLYWAQPHRL